MTDSHKTSAQIAPYSAHLVGKAEAESAIERCKSCRDVHVGQRLASTAPWPLHEGKEALGSPATSFESQRTSCFDNGDVLPMHTSRGSMAVQASCGGADLIKVVDASVSPGVVEAPQLSFSPCLPAAPNSISIRRICLLASILARIVCVHSRPAGQIGWPGHT